MKSLVTLLALTALANVAAAGNEHIPLAGKWRFQLDHSDVGVSEAWFNRTLPDRVSLPGGLTEQGIGDDITTNTPWTGSVEKSPFFTAPEYAKYRKPGNVKVPFWLQPEKYYAGAAWYQRDIEIPGDWGGRRTVLFLERPHWETRVWVDGTLIGTNQSLFTPHEYDLGQLAPGKHTLALRVDNRMIVDIGCNSHGISDHTQGNWNGVVGRIELRSTPLAWIDEVQVYPDLATRSVAVKVFIGNATGQPGEDDLSLSVTTHDSSSSPAMAVVRTHVAWAATGGVFQAGMKLPAGAACWDEFHPNLYSLHAGLSGSGAHAETTFGLREFGTDGTEFILNGHRIFLRGTLECAIFPKTGHPPTDKAAWQRIMRTARAYGLNHLRFHSWCPPEAAFEVADEMGFYLQVETCWANRSTTLGDGKPVDQWVYDETERILKAYGNHPSFMLMPYGNEPGGRHYRAFLAKYVEHFKERDPRRLWSGGASWPEIPENQFYVVPKPRIQKWGQGLRSRINARPPETTTDYRDFVSRRQMPVISHEIGQWCAYPNFEEIRKYTGYLKPKNFEIFRDTLEANGLGGFAKQFLLASGKLQVLCYKEEIESALRTPGFGGFQLLDLHDFPGQGTALVGVLDPFWEEKGYVTAKEYSRFCNSVVPLARMQKRVFTPDEKLTAQIEVANFAATPMTNAVAEWKLVTDGARVVAQGTCTTETLPIGNTTLGDINPELSGVRAPARLKLVLTLKGTPFENDWDVWVYPTKPATEPARNILLTSRFDDAARAHLASGGKVLLTLPGSQVRNYDKDPVKLGFSSIFWNTAWTGRQAPTTLGILCDPKHPALAEFPTDFHSNWQWWYLIHRAGALRLDQLPANTQPVVRVIDDWVTARPLGLVVEGRIGKGTIMVCGFDLTDTALTDPVSRQMRASLLNYLGSDQCRPAIEFSVEQIASLIHRSDGT